MADTKISELVGALTGATLDGVADELAAVDADAAETKRTSPLAIVQAGLRDGALLADLDAGGNAVTNVGLVDGRDVSADGATLDALAASAGDVDGPASSTDNAIARFDGVTGKLIQNGSATLDDAGAMTLPDGGSLTIAGGTNPVVVRDADSTTEFFFQWSADEGFKRQGNNDLTIALGPYEWRFIGGGLPGVNAGGFSIADVAEIAPDVTGRAFGQAGLRWDAFLRDVDVSGDLTVEGVLPRGLPNTIESGTTRTLSDADSGRRIICTNAAGCTITVPNTLSDRFWCSVISSEDGQQVIIDSDGTSEILVNGTFDHDGAGLGEARTAGEWSPAVIEVIGLGPVQAIVTGDLAAV